MRLRLADRTRISGGRNTFIEGLGNPDDYSDRVAVRVARLDDYLLSRNELNVSLIKIDVEGFELPVLRGAHNYLLVSTPPIICEIVPAAYPSLGARVDETWSYLASLGYKAVDPIDETRTMEPDGLDPAAAINVLFIRRT